MLCWSYRHFSTYCKNLSYFQILDFLNLGFHSFEQICVHYLWINSVPILKKWCGYIKRYQKVFIQSGSSSFLCAYWKSCKHENWNLPFDTLSCGSNFSHMHLSLKRKSETQNNTIYCSLSSIRIKRRKWIIARV